MISENILYYIVEMNPFAIQLSLSIRSSESIVMAKWNRLR